MLNDISEIAQPEESHQIDELNNDNSMWFNDPIQSDLRNDEAEPEKKSNDIEDQVSEINEAEPEKESNDIEQQALEINEAEPEKESNDAERYNLKKKKKKQNKFHFAKEEVSKKKSEKKPYEDDETDIWEF